MCLALNASIVSAFATLPEPRVASSVPRLGLTEPCAKRVLHAPFCLSGCTITKPRPSVTPCLKGKSGAAKQSFRCVKDRARQSSPRRCKTLLHHHVFRFRRTLPPQREPDMTPAILRGRPARRLRRQCCVAMGLAAARGDCDPTGFHAPLKLFSAHPARDAERGGNRLPQADAARGHDPPIQRGHLFLAAARLSRAQEHRADRSRGADAVGRHRDADADAAAGRAVARERALRRLWPGDAALQGPPRARDALRAHQRGVDYADFPRRRAVVSRAAAQPLPYPMEVPRRGSPALRRDARDASSS